MAELEGRVDRVQAERLRARIKHPVAAYSSIADYLRRRDQIKFDDDQAHVVDLAITGSQKTTDATDRQPTIDTTEQQT